jgi:pyruvate formate lyase activating enzyme
MKIPALDQRQLALRGGLGEVAVGQPARLGGEIDETLRHHVHDEAGGSTYCPSCEKALIRRDWYDIRGYHLGDDGACSACGTRIPGRFGKFAKPFGPRRIPVRLAQAA